MKTKLLALTPEQKEKLLRNIWIAHDGRWFLKTTGELGFEAATELNLKVARSIGRTEVKRLMEELDLKRIDNIAQFNEVMEIAADLYFPREHVYEYEIVDGNTFVGHVLECYVYKNVSRAGTADIHQCGATSRFESWLEAFGLDGEIIMDKNTNNCGGTCDVVFKIIW